MKRALVPSIVCLLAVASNLPVCAQAIDSVTVEPAEPTSVDRIRILVEGVWTCPRLSAPEVVDRLVVLSLGPDPCLAPPTRQVFTRYVRPLAPGPYSLVVLDGFDGTVLRRQRFEVTDAGAPPLPGGELLTSTAVPGFRFKVRITDPGGDSRPGTLEPDCLPETLCTAGALEGRTEVLLRVVGPKPNGFLWPTFVRFTTSTVEVWVEKSDTSEVKYYYLPGAVPLSDELDGGFDRVGFVP
jgi:hypothetical protein